jgi:hypothetical protein
MKNPGVMAAFWSVRSSCKARSRPRQYHDIQKSPFQVTAVSQRLKA